MRIVAMLLISWIIVIGKLRYGNLTNPICLFNILWLAILIVLPFSEYFGIYQPSEAAMIIVYTGVLSINIGFFLRKKIKFTDGIHFTQRKNQTYVPNMRLLHIIAIVTLVYFIGSSAEAIIKLLSGVGFSDIRTEYYTYSESTNLAYYIKAYVFMPLQYVVMVSGIISFFSKKKDKLLCSISAINIALQVLQSGGRYVMLNSVYMILVVASLTSYRRKYSKKTKIRAYFIICLFALFAILITNDRTTLNTAELTWYERIIYVIYSYFAGSITYMGRIIETFPNISSISYGINMYAGFIAPIFAFLTFIGIINYPIVFKAIETYTITQMSIGPYAYFNAMPTVFMYFYLDFGFIGVVSESIILGIIIMSAYLNYRSRNDWLSLSLYTLLVIVLLNTSTRYFLYTSSFALSFIYLRLLCKKQSITISDITKGEI